MADEEIRELKRKVEALEAAVQRLEERVESMDRSVDFLWGVGD